MPDPVGTSRPAGAASARAVAKARGRDTDPVASDQSHALIRETLLQIARQRDLLDPHACGALFTLIETGRAVRRYLASVIVEHGLTEAKFCALTILHRLDPEPGTAADLAYHSGVSRSAMTDILDQMVAQGWVARERSKRDRRTVHIRLKTAGRQVVGEAIGRFMAATAGLLDGIPEMSGRRITALCDEINLRLSRPMAETPDEAYADTEYAAARAEDRDRREPGGAD